MKLSFLFSFIILLVCSSCKTQPQLETDVSQKKILPGIHRIDTILAEAKNKPVAVVSNHTGLINGIHLVDTLLSLGVDVRKVFAPEHGFRGNKSDGAQIDDSKDEKTGLPILSLYGADKKPSQANLADVELIIFDIQDVGARFYTYLSTLHYVMEAAAEMGISVIVLDRPNPNGFYIDGPVMKNCCTSFVGLHPVPIVYGMSIGEYALMINGEGWMKDGVACDLKVIPCINYSHSSLYQLPVKPSPNLPDMKSIYLYPSLCLFEGTIVSVGRGTDQPFQIIGEPSNKKGKYSFVPSSISGASVNPKHKGDTCMGYDLSNTVDITNPPSNLNFTWLLRMYEESADRENFFNKNGYFENLAGTKQLREQILAEKTLDEIKASWIDDLANFKEVRKKYLIYPK